MAPQILVQVSKIKYRSLWLRRHRMESKQSKAEEEDKCSPTTWVFCNKFGRKFVEPFIRRPLEANDRVGYMQICGWAGAGGKKFAWIYRQIKFIANYQQLRQLPLAPKQRVAPAKLYLSPSSTAIVTCSIAIARLIKSISVKVEAGSMLVDICIQY